MAGPAPVRIVAAAIRDAAGRVLLVRKRGSGTFIQPGGKREPGEAALDTLARELHEELGVRLKPGSAQALGEFSDDAVHEIGRRVEAQVFVCSVDGEPVPQAEIETMAWVDPSALPEDLVIAPLSRNHILPRVAVLA
ncbi:NUDIX domain-containing protein [Xanthomonadaceae bacterium JHOS43]|nr:NUDIX domain-containing protein [Xanthomonadaceae bacterium JHOS43]MCX7562454.1 NUDIX domain-containing protein [Xanthomonadaceae bacterium XH05]